MMTCVSVTGSLASHIQVCFLGPSASGSQHIMYALTLVALLLPATSQQAAASTWGTSAAAWMVRSAVHKIFQRLATSAPLTSGLVIGDLAQGSF